MAEAEWIAKLGGRALGERVFAARSRKAPAYGPPICVAHFALDVRRWHGPIGEWREHFGKGRNQVCSLDGAEPVRSCQEVEIAKLLRGLREHAFWFSGFGAPADAPWRPWVQTLRTAPAWLVSLDAEIRRQISSPRGGMPDVVAWNDRDALRSAVFVECKGRGEAFKEAQEDWVWAAGRTGVQPRQIAVAVLPF